MSSAIGYARVNAYKQDTLPKERAHRLQWLAVWTTYDPVTRR